jgi:hypothetical protein
MTYWQADLPRAMSLLDECLVSARQLGDALFISTTLKHLADVSGARLDFVPAVQFAEEAVRVAREIGDTASELDALRQLADEYRYLEEFDRVTALIEEMHTISLAHDIRDALGWH